MSAYPIWRLNRAIADVRSSGVRTGLGFRVGRSIGTRAAIQAEGGWLCACAVRSTTS